MCVCIEAQNAMCPLRESARARLRPVRKATRENELMSLLVPILVSSWYTGVSLSVRR